MNLLLLHQSEITANRVTISDRRLAHIREVQRLGEGAQLRAGAINGLMGTATIERLDATSAELSLSLSNEPPEALPLKVILALPRPKMLRRSLQSLASLGVKEIHLINAWRVEKSFWQSPFVQQDALEDQLILGLEQARDTLMPTIHLHQLFKPFVEDQLPEISGKTRKLLAHPNTETSCPIDISDPVTLVIGPEGGFIPYEVSLLESTGFKAVHLGERILRVETAIPVLVSRLYPQS